MDTAVDRARDGGDERERAGARSRVARPNRDARLHDRRASRPDSKAVVILLAALSRFFQRASLAARRRPLETALALAAIAVTAYAIAAPFTAARYPAMTDLPFHAAHTGTFR